MPVIIAAALLFAAAAVMAFFSPVCAGVTAVLGIAMITTFFIYTKKRFHEIEQLNDYLTQVCAGSFDLAIDTNEEGELSLLKNNIYKVIRMLRSTHDEVLKSKENLADALADISHQMKTPLTSMTVMSDLLKDETNEERRNTFLKNIDTQLDKMNWLIITLLKLSKIDAGTVEFKKEPYALRRAVQSAIEPFAVKADLQNVAIDCDVDERLNVTGDKKWDCEAFSNIIKNCLEHTPPGGKLTVTANETLVYTELVIEDTGSGISPEELPHIFERFYRGKNSDENSVGIGLALAQTILNREKAMLDVESELGKGTRFLIKFYKTIV